MTPQQLKNSILQLAIQGKLVEQRPEEGTGEGLFREIQAEKARLVKAGKIKKGKPLPEIAEDELPFEIPETWKWVRLGRICKSITDGDHQPPPQVPSGIPFLVISNVSSGSLDFSNTRFVPFDYFSTLSGERIAEKGDLLFTVTGSYGISVKVDCDTPFCFQRHIALLKIMQDCDYLFYILKSNVVKNQCDDTATGIAQKTVGLSSLRNIMIPLPPLPEQKRIVAKIEELLPLVDRYEQAWNQLEAYNKRFPADMQKAILQWAIQGKLVEQRPEEGTGEELYRQIQAEKARLVKAGKIRKEKPLAEIAEDELPFEIPENWKWVKLGSVASVLGGKRIPAGRRLTAENTGHIYIRISDMKNASVKTDGLLYVPEDIYPSISRYIIKKEDIYITVAGTIGSVGTIPAELDGSNLTENADRIVFSLIDQSWFVKCLQSSLVQNQIADATTKVGQPKLAIKRIQELRIPLPPLAEQKRIVAKIEELLPLCDALKGKVS